MGLFDFFSRKNQKPVAKDPLNAALQRAMDDPENREAFYDCLLRSEVLVRTEKVGIKGAGKGEIRMVSFADGTLPIFSCLDRLLDDESMDGFPSYTGIAAKELFTTFSGTTFWLNPFSTPNKIITPEEVAYISIPPAGPSQVVELPEGSGMLIGIPKEIPDALLTALRHHFKEFHIIAAAYLSLIILPDSEDAIAHYLISVVLDYEIDDFGELIPQNLTRFIEAGSYVDFTPVFQEDVDEENSILFYQRTD